ncbi:MAG: T9SS type A sorting domain-containing protein, partial [Elusimicrobia bacterium]|nr:T9SS type A sorting domain-containing protein [Elusimicrobiota bacterium]
IDKSFYKNYSTFCIIVEMKKIAICFFLLIVPAVTAGVKVDFPSRDAMRVDVENSALKLAANGCFDSVKSPGCRNYYKPGFFDLPVRYFSVSIPADRKLSRIKIEKIEEIPVAGNFNIRVIPPPVKIGGVRKGGVSLKGRNPPPAEIVSVQNAGSLKVVSFAVPAARYDFASRKLFSIKKVGFKVSLMRTLGTFSPRTKTNFRIIRSFVVNSADVRMQTVGKLQNEAYLIITNDALKDSFQALSDAKTAKGLNAMIETTKDINQNYAGSDLQEKIRNCIIDYYNTQNLKYVLLGGDESVVPSRRVYSRVSGSALADVVAEDSTILCDFYYACFSGSWDADGDGTYGEVEDNVSFIPDVFVGRAPVSDISEADNFVSKALYFPERNKFRQILMGVPLDSSNDGKDIVIKLKDEIPSDFDIVKMYYSDGTMSESAFLSKVEDIGVDFIAHAGHGDWNWLDTFFDFSTVRELSNTSPFVFYTIGCYAGAFDYSDCIGEEFVKNAGGGCAFIGNSRYGLYDDKDPSRYSGEFMNEFYRLVFSSGYKHIGEAFERSKLTFSAQSSTYTAYRWIEMCLNLFGDPEMVLPIEKRINFVNAVLNDGASFIVEPQENNEIVVTVENLTADELKNVSVSLETDDPYVAISSSYSFLGDMSSTAIASNETEPFKFTVSEKMPCEHPVYFSLLEKTTDYSCYQTFSFDLSMNAENLVKVYNYPNPSRGESINIVNIPRNSNPVLHIYTLSGREIATLTEGNGITNETASMKAIWNLKNLANKKVASGIYYYFLETDKGSKKGKIALIR